MVTVPSADNYGGRQMGSSGSKATCFTHSSASAANPEDPQAGAYERFSQSQLPTSVHLYAARYPAIVIPMLTPQKFAKKTSLMTGKGPGEIFGRPLGIHSIDTAEF
jgi:hypothetical protein